MNKRNIFDIIKRYGLIILVIVLYIFFTFSTMNNLEKENSTYPQITKI